VTVLRIVIAVAGGVLVVWVLGSTVNTLVVPRGSGGPISRATAFMVDAVIGALVRVRRGEAARNRLLGAQSPAYLLTLLVFWLVLLAVGFAALLLPITGSVATSSEEAVSSLLTLGFTKTGGGAATAIDFIAAGSGLLTVALLVGYLPTIYAGYNRRETEVTLLAARTGTPPWGPELLARTRVGIQGEDSLDELYRSWERWSADVAETHVSYPSLLWFRSPNPNTHWTVALLAVLDSAALFSALSPSRAPASSRLALRMGFVALQDIADALAIPYDPDPRPDSPLVLTRDEFDAGLARLKKVGFNIERSDDDAWAHFRGWRVNYEPVAYALASMTDAVPARWSGPRRRQTITVIGRTVIARTPEYPEGLPPAEWAARAAARRGEGSG
jgi:hypothetical protein